MRKIDLKSEREYENRKALGENIRQKEDKFYWATELLIREHKLKTLEKIKGKKVLEIGCSYGYDAYHYCKFTSSYCGLDISDQAIERAQNLKLKNAEFLCTDGHEINKDDEEFDCVIVSSLLHHLDLEKSLPEIRRILKPEGILIFREPLGTNPIFQIYRIFTPLSRTPDERPFTFADIIMMKKLFKFEDVIWFGFTNLFSAFIRINFLRKVLTSLDKLLSKTFLKYLFWQFSGFAKKI